MKKKIFSKGLYFEGIRQLRMTGIISSVIFTLMAVLIPAGNGISIMIHEKQSIEPSADGYIREIISGPQANYFLIPIFLVLAPLMSILLFSFLSKRRTADFYHSIPHTRLCIYLSFTASILTWIAFEILLSSGAAALTYLIFSRYFEVLYTDLLIFMAAAFAASVLAVGAVSIAVSVTGTIGSNVMLSAMILLLPRLFIFAINNTMINQTPVISKSGIFPLFQDSYNLYTALLFTAFSNFRNMFEPYLQAHGIIYTLILGLIYLGLGMLLFVRRKSESAERSAPSRALQIVYRTLITSAFCLIPCILFFTSCTEGYGIGGDTILSIVALYILALVIYFGYEIITTRKWKNLLRAIPGLGIVLLVNVAVIGGLFGTRAYHLSFTPGADEITGISVLPNDEADYYYGELSYEDYVNSQMGEIVLNSDEAKKIVSKALSGNVEALKVSIRSYNNYGSGGAAPGESEAPYQELTFRIKTNGGSRVRRIKIPASDADRIEAMLSGNEQYSKLWTTIPEPASDVLSYDSSTHYFSGDIPKEITDEFIATLRDEVAHMDIEVWKDIVKGSTENDDETIASVIYAIRTGTNVYFYELPISYKHMPRTSALFLKMINNDAEGQKAALDALERMLSKDNLDPGTYTYFGQARLYLPNSDGGIYSFIFDMTSEPANISVSKRICGLLKDRAEFGTVEYGQPFAALYVNEVIYEDYNSSGGKYSSYTEYMVYIPLTSFSEEELAEIIGTSAPQSGPYID